MNRRTQPGLEKPLLIFDGDCGFCRYWVLRWQWEADRRIDCEPYQTAKARFPEIPERDFAEAVQLVEPGGRVTRGAEAAFRAMGYGSGLARKLPLFLYQRVPGVAAASNGVYRLVAARREVFSKLTRAFLGREFVPPQFELTRWLFLRLLGVVYLIAFLSLWTQVRGLVGRDGILPVGHLIGSLQGSYGLEGVWMCPTLSWLSTSDTFLLVQCALGALLSILLILSFAPAASLALLWVLYLSLVTAGQEFLSFQWDMLLLEAGFLAIFWAPLQILPNLGREKPPSRLVVWLLRILVIKLMFMSGVVKLASGDPTWRDLTAMDYHYWTQPLPTVFAWFANLTPGWMKKLSVLLMFAIELGTPILILGPRRVRSIACAAIVFLQAMIFFTGNYCFFNLLTAVLCLTLLDDGVWPARLRDSILGRIKRWRLGASPTPSRAWSGWIVNPVAALSIFIAAVFMVNSLRLPFRWPRPILGLISAVSPFRSFNGYGLFMFMTTSRPEIIFEGSDNGVDWHVYEFKYKPGDLRRAPCWVQPHQPRLDWQLWFAAFQGPRNAGWFAPFCYRLLEGSPDVTRLLEKNPFPEKPPRFLRATLYEYHFTDWKVLRATGEWWRREKKGLFAPVLMIQNGELVPASAP